MGSVLTEHQIQASVFDWIKIKQLSNPIYKNVVATPNGAHLARGPISYNRLKAEGFSPGFPDISVLVPKKSPDGFIFHGLFIEQKRPKGELSENQKDWLKRLNEAGYIAIVSFSAEETIKIIEDWIERNGAPTRKKNT